MNGKKTDFICEKGVNFFSAANGQSAEYPVLFMRWVGRNPPREKGVSARIALCVIPAHIPAASQFCEVSERFKYPCDEGVGCAVMVAAGRITGWIGDVSRALYLRRPTGTERPS